MEVFGSAYSVASELLVPLCFKTASTELDGKHAHLSVFPSMLSKPGKDV